MFCGEVVSCNLDTSLAGGLLITGGPVQRWIIDGFIWSNGGSTRINSGTNSRNNNLETDGLRADRK